MNQQKFHEILKDRYLSHFHTTYTDGKLSIENYFEFCNENNIKYLIFSEHVRKKLNYDFIKYCKEVNQIAKKFTKVNFLMGAEAKFLPSNELDLNNTILENIDVLFFACHGFPNDIKLFNDVVKTQFRNPKYNNVIKIWAHPGRFFKKHPLKNETTTMKNLINIAQENQVFLERNKKDNLIKKEYLKYVDKKNIIIGHDIHTENQLKNYNEK